MLLRKWIAVTLFVALSFVCLPVHAQYPYPYGWQGYFGTAQSQINANANANAARAANGVGSPVVATGGSGYVPPATGFTTLPIHIAIPRHPLLPSIRVNDGETSIYCTTGTLLSLAGYASADSYISPALDVDHRHAASDDICKVTGQYLFYWKASEPGLHILRVITTPVDGAAPVVARLVRVIVSDNSPVSISTLPATCDADTQAPLARTTAADFKPARSIVIVNDSGFDLANTQKALAIPASKMPDGDYAISTASYSADGTRFVSMPQVLHIQHGKGPDWSMSDLNPK